MATEPTQQFTLIQTEGLLPEGLLKGLPKYFGQYAELGTQCRVRAAKIRRINCLKFRRHIVQWKDREINKREKDSTAGA